MLRPHAAPKLMCAHRGLVFQLFAHITVGRDISERDIGIEPTLFLLGGEMPYH